MKRAALILGLVFIAETCVWAQASTENDSKPGTRNFLLAGSANMLTILDAESFDEALFGVGWLPTFLWQPSERLMVECHLHIEVEAVSGVTSDGGGHSHGGGHGAADTEEEVTPGGSGAMVMLGFANLIYILNDYMTLTAGQFIAPIGTFQERMHPAWVNKLPDAPIGFSHHHSMAPAEIVGVQLRGGIPFGKMKMNYAAYVSNGPVLLTSEMEGGQLGYENFMDNNKNKTIGGRLGLLPLSNSSLEIGVSGLTGKVGGFGTEYQNVSAYLYSGDLSYFKSISGFGDINLKAQLVHSGVSDAMYPMDTMIMIMGNDTTYMTEYTFDNQTEAYYAQVSYRPSKAEKKAIKNLEFVVRYDAMTMPQDAMWAATDSRYTFGIDYWMQARSVVKLAYQIGENQDVLMAQFVIGF